MLDVHWKQANKAQHENFICQESVCESLLKSYSLFNLIYESVTC